MSALGWSGCDRRGFSEACSAVKSNFRRHESDLGVVPSERSIGWCRGCCGPAAKQRNDEDSHHASSVGEPSTLCYRRARPPGDELIPSYLQSRVSQVGETASIFPSRTMSLD